MKYRYKYTEHYIAYLTKLDHNVNLILRQRSKKPMDLPE